MGGGRRTHRRSAGHRPGRLEKDKGTDVMTRVRICGIRNAEQATAAAKAGADLIGLVFAPSPRQVTPDVAVKIRAALKKHKARTEMVGGFVNVHAGTINR